MHPITRMFNQPLCRGDIKVFKMQSNYAVPKFKVNTHLLFVVDDLREVIDSEPRLLSVALHVHCVPDVVIEAVDRLVFNHLDAVTDVVAELDCISIWEKQNSQLEQCTNERHYCPMQY